VGGFLTEIVVCIANRVVDINRLVSCFVCINIAITNLNIMQKLTIPQKKVNKVYVFQPNQIMNLLDGSDHSDTTTTCTTVVTTTHMLPR
jgi:hypothetical protein